MNKTIINAYTESMQINSGMNHMTSYKYIWRGQIRDTQDNWVDAVGYTQFYHMLDIGELMQVTETINV